MWKALTTAELIGRWLMPNDFEPVVGKRFTFKTRPIGDWDGVVQCEVLEIVPHRRLVYRGRAGRMATMARSNYGSRLDSVVTWTLQPEGRGTRLRLVHSGFRSPAKRLRLRRHEPRLGPHHGTDRRDRGERR